MFFILSKVLGFFVVPSNLLIGCAFLGMLLLPTRLAGPGRRLMVGSLFVLALAGFSPLGNVLILPLEDRFPPWDASRGPPDGIVVLGGAIVPDVSVARNDAALTDAAERITAAVALARRYPQARIVYSGGSGTLVYRDGNEAEVARRLLESLGISPSRIVTEGLSRNTVENAVFSLRLAMPRPGERWLLVTSSYHMPRSMGIFRQAGFPIEAYPVDWRTRGTADLLRPFSTLADGLLRTDIAVHEWVGLLVYWATGRSSALFPGPADQS
jgi:uncharacterized SAM-binding protein YcdF (DUF218 family)